VGKAQSRRCLVGGRHGNTMLRVLALENEGPKSQVGRVECVTRDASFVEAFAGAFVEAFAMAFAVAFAAEGGETSVAVVMMLGSFLDAVVEW
jgi:hypothetical protein